MADFSEIIQEINTNLPDNNTQSITAAKLRDTLIDLTNTIDNQQDSFEGSIQDEFSTLQGQVETALDNLIVDNLNSTSTTSALSANQGNELKMVCNRIVVNGNNDTLVGSQYTTSVYVLGGHKYRIYPDHTNVNFSGITSSSSGTDLLRIQNRDKNYSNTVVLYLIGTNKKTDPLQEYYEYTMTHTGYLNILMRATLGETVYFRVEDITSSTDITNTSVGAVSDKVDYLDDIITYDDELNTNCIRTLYITSNGTTFIKSTASAAINNTILFIKVKQNDKVVVSTESQATLESCFSQNLPTANGTYQSYKALNFGSEGGEISIISPIDGYCNVYGYRANIPSSFKIYIDKPVDAFSLDDRLYGTYSRNISTDNLIPSSPTYGTGTFNENGSSEIYNNITNRSFIITKGNLTHLSITANSTYDCAYTFVKTRPTTYYVSLQDLINAGILSSVHTDRALFTILSGTTQEIEIPEDCNYIYIRRYDLIYSTTNAMPTSIYPIVYTTRTLGDIVKLNEEVSQLTETVNELNEAYSTITRHSINLCDESKCSTGTLDSNGEISTGTSIITDFINIDIKDVASFDKTQILKTCYSYTNQTNPRYFDYGAEKVALYNQNKEYIGVIENVSTYIDKDYGDNATMFTNAKYARVQFPRYSKEHYVSIANDRNVPQYSKFNKKDLIATNDFIIGDIHNSDGAITNIVKTGLTYLHNTTQNNTSTNTLGYGNTATAFDQLCEPVVWTEDQDGTLIGGNPRYEGEKQQINCSGFVQLCLEGISYENSRYVLGSSNQNIGINGFVFDSKRESNYHNGSNTITISDYGKMYANKLAKYAYDRGFLYTIAPDFSNIEPGDVIFYGKNPNATDDFYGVHHTSFVEDVLTYPNGSKKFKIIQVEGGGYPVSEATYSTRSIADMIWAARFPLPNISTFGITNLVSSTENTTLSGITTSDNYKVISVATLSENIKTFNEYTVVVKLNHYIPNLGINVYTGSGDTGVVRRGFTGDNDNLLNRQDGFFVCHFHLNKSEYNTTLVNPDNITIKAYAHQNITDTIQVENVYVYNGYVRV